MCDGAQLYLWEYSRFGSSPAPETCLKTRRSLRAVHFHPHAVPLILTAEVGLGICSSPWSAEMTLELLWRLQCVACQHYRFIGPGQVNTLQWV